MVDVLGSMIREHVRCDCQAGGVQNNMVEQVVVHVCVVVSKPSLEVVPFKLCAVVAQWRVVFVREHALEAGPVVIEVCPVVDWSWWPVFAGSCSAVGSRRYESLVRCGCRMGKSAASLMTTST